MGLWPGVRFQNMRVMLDTAGCHGFARGVQFVPDQHFVATLNTRLADSHTSDCIKGNPCRQSHNQG